MSKDVEIITDPEEQSEKDIVRFLKEHVNPLMDEQNFKWQVRTNKETIFVTVSKDGQILGSQSFLYVPFYSRHVLLPSYKSEHSFMSKELRGSDAFQKMYQAGLDQCSSMTYFIWGFTPAMKVWENRLGFNVYPGAAVDARIHFNAIPYSKLRGSKYRLFKWLYYKWQARVTRRRMLNVAGKIKAFSRIAKEPPDHFPWIEELLDDISDLKDDYRMYMNYDYWDWRIRKNKNVNYTYRFFHDAYDISGYFILSDNGHPHEIQLLDFVFRDQTVACSALLELYQLVTTDFKGRNVIYFANQYNKYCKRVLNLFDIYTFTDVKVNHGMIFVLKEMGLKVPYSIENFYFNGLWTEGYNR